MSFSALPPDLQQWVSDILPYNQALEFRTLSKTIYKNVKLKRVYVTDKSKPCILRRLELVKDAKKIIFNGQISMEEFEKICRHSSVKTISLNAKLLCDFSTLGYYAFQELIIKRRNVFCTLDLTKMYRAKEADI